MPHYKVVSFKLCPFVQRIMISLEERGTPYDIEYIELAHKPAWFLELSPLGKVPIMVVDGETVLFESAVIGEYLEDASERKLHPPDPLQRAHHRAWIEFISTLYMDLVRCARADDEADARGFAKTAREKFKRLEQQVTGPLFAGDDFCLVDAAAAPALLRAQWLCEVEPSLELCTGLSRIHRWREQLKTRPSVQRSAVENLEELFVARMEDAGGWMGGRVLHGREERC